MKFYYLLFAASVAPALTYPTTGKATSALHPRTDATLYIRLSEDNKRKGRMTVGNILSQQLYDVVYSAVSKLCPYDEQVDRMKCTPSAAKPVNLGPITGLGQQGNLTLELVNGWFAHGYPGIDNLIYKQIAGTLKAQSEIKENCHRGEQNRLFCSVMEHLGVREDKTGSYMDVKVSSWREPDKFDCESSKNAATQFFDANVRGDLSKLVGVKNMGTYAHCDAFGDKPPPH